MLSWDSFTDTVSKVRERVRFPEPRRPTRTSPVDPTKPVLVRGRSLGRRRPRSPLSSLVAALFALLALLLLLLRLLG
jgi:hypothetical protein